MKSALAWNDIGDEHAARMFAVARGYALRRAHAGETDLLDAVAGSFFNPLVSVVYPVPKVAFLPILFFVVLYFLMIAPNQKKQKKWQAMLEQLKSGDRVTTNGGLRGTVLTVKDDIVVLRIQPDGVKLEFVKSAIAAVTTDEQAA